ncbi:unnamed protein product [Closterium sp. Naga37s-1]|nr:unnamed protein product [Closterium sp. Naga37s-1]
MATGSLKQVAKCRLRDLLVASTACRTFASTPSPVHPPLHHARADSASRTESAATSPSHAVLSAGTTDSLSPAASQPTSQSVSLSFPSGYVQHAARPHGRCHPAVPPPLSPVGEMSRTHATHAPHTLWPTAPRADSAAASGQSVFCAQPQAAARCRHSSSEPCHHDEARTESGATSAADDASTCWLCSADRGADARGGGKGNPSADDMRADAEAEGARGRGDGASKEGDPLTWRFFCGTCGALQPMDKPRLHSLLKQPCKHVPEMLSLFPTLPTALQPACNRRRPVAIPRAFAMDLLLLEQRYKQLQKMLHPDLHGGRSQEERALSAEQAAHVIDAYYTLLRPLSRAKYLLRASAVTAAELSGDSPGRDQQLLMEVMELRETIEDADSPEELQALQSQTQERMEGLYSSFDEAFQRGDVGACVGLLHRMAYFQRVANEIGNRLHSI